MTATFATRNLTMPRTLSLSVLSLLYFSAACQRPEGVAKLPTAAQTVAPATPTPAQAPRPTDAHANTPPTHADLPSAATGSAFFSATTEAHRRSTLTPKVSSAVTRVHVRDGDVVKAGQALVTLDTQDFALRTQQAEAGLLAATVQRDSAKLDFERTKLLLADKAVPQSQFDMIDARYKGALAGVAQAEAAVALGKKALRDATVRAPFSGLVVKRMVNEGEYATVMPATPLVIMEEVDPIDLRIQLPAAEMGKVKAGDTVHVRFPATGQTMDIRITRVVAAMDPRTRTFAAIAEIPNPDQSLRTGLYAEVTLERKATPHSPMTSPPKKSGRGKKG